ncbi:MAG: FIST C-terminal domain-containing protein [Synergistaceae bacterium]|jgi:hypothetical protein|nr:FIST C-terminal domain-containing protein [Synergistaceae bacterium]
MEMLTAYTEETEDAGRAVSEVLAMIDRGRLSKNSAGILHCHSDFLGIGVVGALHDALGFDIVGCTTISSSARGVMSKKAMVLSVLTSDDVVFAAGASASIFDDAAGPVEELYRKVFAPIGSRPAMFFAFVPRVCDIGGDEFLRVLDGLSENVPAFGSIPISNDPDSGSRTIYNGMGYGMSVVLLALYGDVDPDFLSVPVDYKIILRQKALVTGVTKNILHTVNNMPAVKYLESIGLIRGNDVTGLESMPLVFYPEDGAVIARACMKVAPDGGLVLTGTVPKRSTLAFSATSPDAILRSTEDKVWEALALARGRGMLMYSCASRFWTLGLDGMKEHKKVGECIGKASAYCMAYSGGELCPSCAPGGRTENMLFNDSFVICIL